MNTMRRSLATVAIVVGCVLATRAAPQSPRELYERARMLEESNQNLSDAIALYTRVTAQAAAAGQRELAASAQLRIGLLHERLGRRDEAGQAFNAILEQFADQVDAVRQAQARLSQLTAGPAAGPSARRIWAGGDVELSGSPSPDGRYVSYVDWETGDLAIREVATGTRRRLTGNPTFMRAEGFVQESSFAPDGREIAYIWFDDQGMDLRVVRVEGGTPRILCRDTNRAMLRVSWGGDGRQIAVTYQQPDRTNQIALVAAANGAVRVLKTLDWRAPARMALSPDGRHLAYDFPPKENAPARDIYVLAVDGSRETVVVDHSANDLFPVWTPDGRQLVFVSDRTGAPGLWSVAIEDGRLRGAPRLVQSVGNVRPIGFSKAGAFFYGVGTGTTDAYVAALDVVSGKLIEPPRPAPRHVTGVNSRPRWSPDGRYLAFQSDRVPGGGNGARRLIVQTIETGEERDLNVPLPYFQRAEWAPDGRSLLVQARAPQGSRGFFKIDVASGATTLAVPLPQGGFGETWSPDGRSIFYTGAPSGGAPSRRAIVERTLESGAERVVYQPGPGRGAGDASVSPDARWLAFREGNSPAVIKVVPVAGGDARDIVRVDEPYTIGGFSGINWTPDAQRLLFVRMIDKPGTDRTVWTVPVSGGAAVETELRAKELRDLHLHRDGRRVAFTAGEGADELWVLDHFLSPVSAPTPRGGRR